jgi:large subunit ribosomal protein L3
LNRNDVMEKAIIGEKVGMTQVVKDDLMIPVTVIKAGPCVVTQLKSEENDGYRSVQMGFGTRKADSANKPLAGHFRKSGTDPTRVLAELPLDPAAYKNGQKIKVDIFSEGDLTDITGVSKGKGFAGVVKRWGFGGGPGSHGSRFHRAPGSIGQCATPSRVFKGKKMPGRMGSDRVTVQNLLVVEVDRDKDLMLVKGAVPGAKGTVVLIRESVKNEKKKRKR